MSPTRIPTTHAEPVAKEPPCPIWWFLAICGMILIGWLSFLTLRATAADEATAKASAAAEAAVETAKTAATVLQARADAQYSHIVYRLDQLDKKLDRKDAP